MSTNTECISIGGLAVISRLIVLKSASGSFVLSNGLVTSWSGGGSLASTDYEKNPSIEVNLEDSMFIESVNIWNTTESWGQEDRQMWIIVSDSPISEKLNNAKNNSTMAIRVDGVIGRPSAVPVGANGQYVRIFVKGNDETLDIAEIDIQGWP